VKVIWLVGQPASQSATFTAANQQLLIFIHMNCIVEWRNPRHEKEESTTKEI
jgi:hypothetical protein